MRTNLIFPFKKPIWFPRLIVRRSYAIFFVLFICIVHLPFGDMCQIACLQSIWIIFLYISFLGVYVLHDVGAFYWQWNIACDQRIQVASHTKMFFFFFLPIDPTDRLLIYFFEDLIWNRMSEILCRLSFKIMYAWKKLKKKGTEIIFKDNHIIF